MKKIVFFILAIVFILCISYLPQADVVSRGIIKTTQAWADTYTMDPDYPEPDQFDIDLME